MVKWRKGKSDEEGATMVHSEIPPPTEIPRPMLEARRLGAQPFDFVLDYYAVDCYVESGYASDECSWCKRSKGHIL